MSTVKIVAGLSELTLIPLVTRLGYADEEEELATKARIKQHLIGDTKGPELVGVYEDLRQRGAPDEEEAKSSCEFGTENDENSDAREWKEFWARSG